MKKYVLILGIVLVVCNFSTADEFRLPSYLTTCKRNSAVLKCVLDNFERARPHLAKGIPRLYIPPLAPLTLPELHISGNNLNINLKNLKVHNLDALEVIGGKVQFDNFTLDVNLRLPYIYHEFDYEAEGKILFLNFKGKGSGNINASDVNVDIATKGHTILKDGKAYLVVDDIVVGYKAKAGKIHLDNLFDGQQELNEQTNRLINENFNEFEDEVSPDIAKSVGNVIKAIASVVLEKFSYDDIFPLE